MLEVKIADLAKASLSKNLGVITDLIAHVICAVGVPPSDLCGAARFAEAHRRSPGDDDRIALSKEPRQQRDDRRCRLVKAACVSLAAKDAEIFAEPRAAVHRSPQVKNIIAKKRKG